MNREQLQNYLHDEENGVKKTINHRSGLKMEVYALRPELIYGKTKPVNKLDSLQYFMISFSKENREALLQAGAMNTYSKLVENLSYNTSQFCRLIVDKKDTVQLENSTFSNEFGTSPANSLLLIFKTKLPESQYELDLDELGFNIGDTKVVFQKKDLDQFTHINLKN